MQMKRTPLVSFHSCQSQLAVPHTTLLVFFSSDEIENEKRDDSVYKLWIHFLVFNLKTEVELFCFKLQDSKTAKWYFMLPSTKLVKQKRQVYRLRFPYDKH